MKIIQATAEGIKEYPITRELLLGLLYSADNHDAREKILRGMAILNAKEVVDFLNGYQKVIDASNVMDDRDFKMNLVEDKNKYLKKDMELPLQLQGESLKGLFPDTDARVRNLKDGAAYLYQFCGRPDMDMRHSVHRLVVSHNDLDGLWCTIMMRFYTGIRERLGFPNDYLHFETAKNPQDAERIVKEWIDGLEGKAGYKKGDSDAYILVTDLSVSPEIFLTAKENGHNISWGIVDHHPDFHGYATMENANGENQYKRGTLRSGYFIDTNCCASWTLNLMLMKAAVMADSKENLEEAYPILADGFLGAIWMTKNVNLYDLGRWGQWSNSQSFGFVPDEVKEQLYLSSFTEKDYDNGCQSYVEARLHDLQQPNFLVHAEIRTPDRVGMNLSAARTQELQARVEAVEAQFTQLKADLELFEAKMQPLYPASNTDDLFTVPVHVGDITELHVVKPDEMDASLNVYGVIIDTKEDTARFKRFFSMISREILTKRTDIDILVTIDNMRGTVQLRTAKGSINLSKLAQANGGNGHPKASGFPIK